MRQKTRKKNIKKMFSNKKGYLYWFLLGLFISLTILFTVQTAASGAQIAEIERTKNSLIIENKLLESEVIGLSSLKKIEDNAEELGFIKPLKILYVNDGQDVAKAE